jgi:hypothetical protein
MQMTTDRTTRFAAFMLAVLMTVAINGAMLWRFDTLAQDGVLASAEPAAVMTLETVTIVASRT